MRTFRTRVPVPRAGKFWHIEQSRLHASGMFHVLYRTVQLAKHSTFEAETQSHVGGAEFGGTYTHIQ